MNRAGHRRQRSQQQALPINKTSSEINNFTSKLPLLHLQAAQAQQVLAGPKTNLNINELDFRNKTMSIRQVPLKSFDQQAKILEEKSYSSERNCLEHSSEREARSSLAIKGRKSQVGTHLSLYFPYFKRGNKNKDASSVSRRQTQRLRVDESPNDLQETNKPITEEFQKSDSKMTSTKYRNNNSDQKDMRITYLAESQLMDQKSNEESEKIVKLSPFGLVHQSPYIDKPRSSQLSNEILRDTTSQNRHSKESLDLSSKKGMNEPVYYTSTKQNGKQGSHGSGTRDLRKRSGPLKPGGSGLMDEKLRRLWLKETARMQQPANPPQQYKMSINTLRYEPERKRDGQKQQRSPTQRNHNMRLEQLKHRQSVYVKSLSSKMEIQGVKLPNLDDQLLMTSSIQKSKNRRGKRGQNLKTQESDISPTNKSRELEANLSITNINERTLSSKDQPQPTSSPRQQIEMKLHLPTTPPFNKAGGATTGVATHFSSTFIQSNDPYGSSKAIEGTAEKTMQGSQDSSSTDGKRDAAAGQSIAEESRGGSREALLDIQQRDVLRQKSEYQKILEFDMDLKKQSFRNFEGFRPKQLRKKFVTGSQHQASQLSQSANLNINDLMRDGELLQKMSPRKLAKKLKESITLPMQRESIKIQPTNNTRDALLNPLDNVSSQSRWLKNYAFEMRDGYLQPFSFQDVMPFDRKPSIDHQFQTHFTSSLNFGLGQSSASKQIMHSDSLGEQTTPYGSTIKTTTNDVSKSDDRLFSHAQPTSYFGTRTAHQYQQVGGPGTAGFGGRVAVQGNEGRFRNTVQGQGTMGPGAPGQGPSAAGAKQKGYAKPSDLLDERGKQALEEKSLSAINSPRKLSYQLMMKRQHVGVSETPENMLVSPSVNFGFKPKLSSLKNRTPRSQRKIDFARSTLFEDNNLNVELYRSQIGDQKFTHRNRYRDVGGPTSKKMSYHSNLASRALKIAGMGIDPQRYIESEQTPTMPTEKIIFAGQEIDNKELNFETCSKYYNVKHGFQNVHKDIEKSSLMANAKQLKKLPLFKNVKMKNLTNTMTSMRFQELKMQHQNQYFTPRNSDLRLSHYSSKLMRSRYPFDIDVPDDFLSEINQDSDDVEKEASVLEPLAHFQTNIFELVSKEKQQRRNKSFFLSKAEPDDQIRKLTEQSLMVHTAERFLSQLKLQDKVKKFTSQQKASLVLQPLISKDYFQELQVQNQLDQRISEDMELSLNSQQMLNIKNLKYLQGLKRKTNVKIAVDKNKKNRTSNMITEQMKTNAKEFQDRIKDLQVRNKYYRHHEFIEKHQQNILDRTTPKIDQYQDQIKDLNEDFETYQKQQQDRIANMKMTLTNFNGGGSQSPNKRSGRIEHRRTSIPTKLQESNFYVNHAREQKRQDFLKHYGGFEEDYYTSCKQKKREKRILDEIEDDKLMRKLQDQSMERDLRNIVRMKLDEMTFIEDAVDRWSPRSEASDLFDELGEDRSLDSDDLQTGQVNTLNTQSNSENEEDSKSSEGEDLDPEMRKHHPADEKIKKTQDQLHRMEEQKKVFEESKKEFTDKILNDQIHELATRINQQILDEFKKLKKQGVFRRSTQFKFKQKRLSPTLEGKYEKRVNEVIDLLKSNFLDLQKLKQDILEIQQVARDEEDKQNVFALMAKKIKAQHESIMQNKVEYRKKLSKDGIKMIDDYTQKKLEESIARKNHNLMLINNYIKNGGDFSLLSKLYQKQYQEAKLRVLRECYAYYKGQIELREEREQRRLQRKEAQKRALQKLKEQQYRLKRMEEEEDI